MRVTPTALRDVIVVEPDLHRDARGYFLQAYHERMYAEHGIPGPFVQDNLTSSVRGVLRGLHYQLGHAQGKLVMALTGTIFDVAVDIRRGSPTFGQWVGLELSGDSNRHLWIPPGFAHGYCVLSEVASVLYKCTDFYSPSDERGLLWNDPALGIAWPVSTPSLSPKDRANKCLAEMTEELPRYPA